MTTKRTSPAAARRAAQAARAAAQATTASDPTVEARIASYIPKDAAADWATIGPVVAAAVRRSDPGTPDRAQHLMFAATKLVTWAKSRGLELDERLFTEPVVEEWVRHALDIGTAKKSVASYRSLLRALSVDPARIPIRRQNFAAPYSSSEDLAVRRAVTGQRTPIYRAVGSLLYGLARGAGLSSTDIRSLRRSDLHIDGTSIAVDTAGRRVWVLDELAAIVAAAVNDLPVDGYLVSGRDGNRRNIGAYIDRFTVPDNTPRLNLQRCRATWTLDHLRRRTPVQIIREALGTAGLSHIEAQLPYLDAVDPVEAEAHLRGNR